MTSIIAGRWQPTVGQIRAFCVTLVIWATLVAPWVCVLHCHFVMEDSTAVESLYVCIDMVADPVEHQHNQALPMSLWLTLGFAFISFNEESLHTVYVPIAIDDRNGIDIVPIPPPPKP